MGEDFFSDMNRGKSDGVGEEIVEPALILYFEGLSIQVFTFSGIPLIWASCNLKEANKELKGIKL